MRPHPHPTRVDVIFNPVSGTRDAARDERVVRGALRARFADVRLWVTDAETGVEGAVARAVAEGGVYLVAAGGDGTVAAVCAAAVLRRGGAPRPTLLVGVLPKGTANAFAACLGIGGFRDGLRLVGKAAGARECDVALVDGGERGVMLTQCDVGIGDLVVSVGAGWKRIFGVFAYFAAAISGLFRQEWFSADIVLCGVKDKLFAGGCAEADKILLSGMRLKGVTVANAAPVTSVLAQGIGEVRPDDGLLEVVCVAPESTMAFVSAVFSMLTSALLRKRVVRGDVYGLRARTATIVCTPPQRVAIDGDDAGLTPITISVGAARSRVAVIAPKPGLLTRRRRRLSRALVRLWRNARGAAVLAVIVAANRVYSRRER